jgi:hypothetical protein
MGIVHAPNACPLVKAVEYFRDGTIKRVERFSPAEMARTRVPGSPIDGAPIGFPYQAPGVSMSGSSGRAGSTVLLTSVPPGGAASSTVRYDKSYMDVTSGDARTTTAR